MFLRRIIAVAAVALSVVSSGSDLLTSPAYMGVPGNVWNTMLICNGERADVQEPCELGDHDPHDDGTADPRELMCVGVFFVVAIALGVVWFVAMRRRGY